jgi:hypothetical protein
MIDDTKPTGFIVPQILTNSPIGVQTTLVNDPIALVNDPIALVGGQTTQIRTLRISTSGNAPTGFIVPRR